MEYPKKIEPCPIVEAIIEIRFSSMLPSEAVFGIIFGAINKDFEKTTNLPILQLPEAVRSQDPALKYHAYNSFTNDDNSLKVNVGPKVITFINSETYLGWGEFFSKIKNILTKIIKTNVIQKVERIGIRYINFFSQKILKSLNLSIKVDNEELKDEPTTLRTEFTKDNFVRVIQVVNQAPVNIRNTTKIGSLVDIDCIYTNTSTIPLAINEFSNIINKGHQVEKETFYNLLKPEFIKTLNPVY